MSLQSRSARYLASVAGLFALSCGSPSQPPAVGALSITIGGGGSGDTCSWPNTGAILPTTLMMPLQAATSSAEVDGREGVETCAVRGTAATGYEVSGRIRSGAVVFNVSPVAGAPVSTLGGQVNIRLQQQGLPDEGINSVTPCTARALEAVDDGGAIFMEFSCPTLTASLSPGSTCSTTNARLILENCQK